MSDFRHWYETIDRRRYAAWLRSRPKIVRAVMREFPLGSHIDVYGADHVVFGATEGGDLIVVPYAARDYDDAYARRSYICTACQRAGKVHILK